MGTQCACSSSRVSPHTQLQTSLMRSRLKPMKKVAGTLRNHRSLILNSFRARKQISAGAVEALNN